MQDAVTNRLAFAALLPLTALAVLLAVPCQPLMAQDAFPHAAHARLFPLCAGCHAAALDAGASMYPAPPSCRNCHDGEQLGIVHWTAPAAERRSSFDHVAHVRAAREAGTPLDCVDCHVRPGADRMSVGALNVGTACAGCHRTHVADSECSLCHTPRASDHPRTVHAGCDGCHEEVKIDALPKARSFCLVCHTDLRAHFAARRCVECHIM